MTDTTDPAIRIRPHSIDRNDSCKPEANDPPISAHMRPNHRAAAWGTADPSGLHGNSVSLVNLDDAFMDRYLSLPMRRTFIYGEHSLPNRPEDVTADAPDPRELQAHGVAVSVVPNAGHLMMLDNLDGFVEVVQQAIE